MEQSWGKSFVLKLYFGENLRQQSRKKFTNIGDFVTSTKVILDKTKNDDQSDSFVSIYVTRFSMVEKICVYSKFYSETIIDYAINKQ